MGPKIMSRKAEPTIVILLIGLVRLPWKYLCFSPYIWTAANTD